MVTKGLPPVESDRIIAGGGAESLRLRAATINGQRLGPDMRRLTVARSTRLRGLANLHVTTNEKTAALLLAAIPTWGDRRGAFIALKALPPQADNDSMNVPVDLPGPERPGRYFLVLAFAAETEARFVASGTNWVLGSPRWFDGNDLADLQPAQADSMNQRGGIFWPWAYPMTDDPANAALRAGRPIATTAPSRLPVHREHRWLAATTIEVVVH